MRKFIFRIFPKFSPFPKTFLGNSPIFPIPLRKKFFGEMEALTSSIQLLFHRIFSVQTSKLQMANRDFFLTTEAKVIYFFVQNYF